MRNVMIDLETMGQRPGCVVLSIGAVAFDENGLGPEFYSAIYLPSCTALGLHLDPDTQKWWSQQSEAARQVIAEANDEKTPDVHTVIRNFNPWLQQFTFGAVKVWGNGANFDNPILTAVYEAAGLKAPWKFYNDRCYRTLKAIYKDVPKVERQGTYHNALDDAKTQALHAVEIFKAHGIK